MLDPAPRRALLAALIALAAIAITPRARAAEGSLHLKVDWDSLVRSMEELRAGSPQDTSHARVVDESRAKWISTEGMLVSLVARNWEGASRLAGGPMPVTDAVRVSRSSRLLVGRIAFAAGKVVPFIHIGLGQWRDPDQRLINAPLEYASQVGAGVELARVWRACAVAVEYDWTRLYGVAWASDASRTHGWGEAFAVLRFDLDAEVSAPGR